MRHRKRGRKLGVSPSHRHAMGRNMIKALLDHERIVTTIEKAKQFKPLADKIIHIGKVASQTPVDTDQNKAKRLNLLRKAASLIGDRELENPLVTTETVDDGKEKITKSKVIGHTTLQKLIKDIGPRNVKRNGGYTRIIKLARKRVGDNASRCIFELVESKWTKVDKPEKAEKAEVK